MKSNINTESNSDIDQARSLKQKQPPRGVLGKKYSENMQQIYRRTPMLLCNFIEIPLQHVYFQNIFY